MSFFKKLKSKLFRSSSRIEEGIDAIVENEDSEAENNLLDDEDKTGQQLETEVLPEPEPEPEPQPEPEPEPEPDNTQVSQEESSTKKSFFGRVFKRKDETKKVEKKRLFDDNMLESLEELLISADMGVDTSLRVSANMAEGNLGKRISVNEVKTLL